MPYRKEQFANGEIFHVVVRALDDNLLFNDENDYFRMIFSVYELNNSKPVNIFVRRRNRNRFKKFQSAATDVTRMNVAGATSGVAPAGAFEEDKRDRLVDIFCFEWMPNHIHLLIKQLQDGGISKFMRKVGVGYSKYFNGKYHRQGHLFQDVFRAVHIETEEQLFNVFVYIHTNAIALIESGWKENGVRDSEKVKKFLEQEYRWSSYWDYLGKRNFPSVTEREFLLGIVGGLEGAKRAVDAWIDYKGEVNGLLQKSFAAEELKFFE